MVWFIIKITYHPKMSHFLCIAYNNFLMKTDFFLEIDGKFRKIITNQRVYVLLTILSCSSYLHENFWYTHIKCSLGTVRIERNWSGFKRNNILNQSINRNRKWYLKNESRRVPIIESKLKIEISWSFQSSEMSKQAFMEELVFNSHSIWETNLLDL